jgi:hypothetical protein
MYPLRRVDIIQGEHAHTKQHIQRGRTFMLGNEQLAVIALQNKLNQDPDEVHTGLLQMMRPKMVDYSSFVKVKKSLSILINLWDKTFCRSSSEFYDQ